MIELYRKVQLKDGRIGIVVDIIGHDYVVDVGDNPENWDTVLVAESEMKKL